jgi:2Fe-2S ferredoxin
MPTVIFIEHNGEHHAVRGEVGQSLMQVAKNNLVPGILADCDGNCACATCHVYIEPEWSAHLAPAGEEEENLLPGVLDQQDNSRLACCVNLIPELDGLVVRLPKSQY